MTNFIYIYEISVVETTKETRRTLTFNENSGPKDITAIIEFILEKNPIKGGIPIKDIIKTKKLLLKILEKDFN
ncbi:hypothetical protein [Mycolicibacterium neoaurum]|uniref:hypothetical protein n=1 Tax=Mycolicibacterium neoaurum TaxID=1795 RepID=UPI001F4D1644|nr:hypothetical protein [Mycolicibacterium neoaurum]